MFSVFFIPEILQYFRVNFSLNVTFDVRQKKSGMAKFHNKFDVCSRLLFAASFSDSPREWEDNRALGTMLSNKQKLRDRP